MPEGPKVSLEEIPAPVEVPGIPGWVYEDCNAKECGPLRGALLGVQGDIKVDI